MMKEREANERGLRLRATLNMHCKSSIWSKMARKPKNQQPTSDELVMEVEVNRVWLNKNNAL